MRAVPRGHTDLSTAPLQRGRSQLCSTRAALYRGPFYGRPMSRVPLPSPLAHRAWSVTEAYDFGLSPSRLRGKSLARPFHGVRSPTTPQTPLELAHAYFTRPRPGQFIIGSTAAQLWGLPLPRRLHGTDGSVSIGVPDTRNKPRGRGVNARQFRGDLVSTASRAGVPVASICLTLLSLSNSVSLEERVVMTDAAISAAENYPSDASVKRPLTTLEALTDFSERCGSATGGRALRDAVCLARPGVESPMESVLRFKIVAAGIREPDIAVTVTCPSGREARLDLAYRDERVALEYDGYEFHANKQQWQRDIHRTRDLQQAGWHVIRVTAGDIYPNADRFLGYLRRVLRSRSDLALR